MHRRAAASEGEIRRPAAREQFAWLNSLVAVPIRRRPTREAAPGCPSSTTLDDPRPPSMPMAAASISICAFCEALGVNAAAATLEHVSLFVRHLPWRGRTAFQARRPASAMQPSSRGSPPFGFGSDYPRLMEDGANGNPRAPRKPANARVRPSSPRISARPRPVASPDCPAIPSDTDWGRSCLLWSPGKACAIA